MFNATNANTDPAADTVPSTDATTSALLAQILALQGVYEATVALVVTSGARAAELTDQLQAATACDY